MGVWVVWGYGQKELLPTRPYYPHSYPPREENMITETVKTAIPQRRYLDFSAAVHGKADEERFPIDGTLELTHRCNLACVHCYVNLSANNPEARKRELTYEGCCRIIDSIDGGGMPLSPHHRGGASLAPGFSGHLPLRQAERTPDHPVHQRLHANARHRGFPGRISPLQDRDHPLRGL